VIPVKPEPKISVLLVEKTEQEPHLAHVLMDILNTLIHMIVLLVMFNVSLVPTVLIIVMNVQETELMPQTVLAQKIL
jgi:hypothetical protein